jgi:hypothetical protein
MKYIELLENLTDLQGKQPAKPAKPCFEAENLRFSVSQTTGKTGKTGKTENEGKLHPALLSLRDYSARLSSGELPANGDTARRLLQLHRRAEVANGARLDLDGNMSRRRAESLRPNLKAEAKDE